MPPAASSWPSIPTAPSPFAAAMRSAVDVAEALWADVRGAYRGSLDYP